MRLTELYLDGFGHFHRQSIGPIEGPVTVFYGPNEAGKSTVLAFIRAVLFGFPTRFNSHYPPLRGGRHGGRIKLSDDFNRVYIVERISGKRGGLKVTTPSGPSSDSEAVLRGLVGSATPDLFKTVFAFSLDELQEAASLQASNIYNAGQGTPGIPSLKKQLAEQKGDIYRSKGRNQEVPRLLIRIHEVDQQLAAVENNASRYGELSARKLEIDTELESAEGQLLALNEKRGEVARLLDGWSDWTELASCEERLEDLPQFENFPESAITRLDSLEAQIRQAQEDLDADVKQLRQDIEAASAPIANEGLLDDASIVEGIRRARSSFDSSVRDLPERHTELRQLKSQLAADLRELKPGWNANDLADLDTSIAVRSEAQDWARQMKSCLERSQQTRGRLDNEKRARLDLELHFQEVQENMPPAPPALDAETLKGRRDELRRARSRLENYERESAQHQTLLTQVNTLASSRGRTDGSASRINSVSLIVLALIGVALVVAGLLLGGNALLLGTLGGPILLVAAAVLRVMRRSDSSASLSPMDNALGRQAKEARKATENSRQSLLQSAKSLGLTGQPDSASLDSIESDLESARSELDAWESRLDRANEASRRLESQEQRLTAAAQEHQDARKSLEIRNQAWQEWLGERGLDKSLTSEAFDAFLARVDTARGSLDAVSKMRDRVTAIERNIARFGEQVTSLAHRHGLVVNSGDQSQLAIAADELIRRLDEARIQLSRREQAVESKEGNRRKLERRKQRLQSLRQAAEDLLELGGTEDPEEFRRRSREHGERMELERQRDDHLRSLQRQSGPGDKLAAFCEALSASDPSQLEGELDRLSARLGEIGGQRDALREERGGNDRERAQLMREEESSALRVRRNTLLGQLEDHARNWSRLTIAEALLDKTRQKFERERQPSVIMHAQEIFSSVTGQRYQRLYAPIGEQTITVTEFTGDSKQPAQLSRGTREQLYLALRFGLIREFGEHAERLPVVVDEVFVNFDPERARAAVEAFSALSETNQVLVFTFQPATVDIFREVAQAQVVRIGQ